LITFSLYIYLPFSVYCLIGDGEAAEGSIWEALHFSSYYKLDNLCAIFDINRLGQSEPTSLQHNMEVYRKRLEAFGFNALVVDGHDVEELAKVHHESYINQNNCVYLNIC
jgi:transketolase